MKKRIDWVNVALTVFCICVGIFIVAPLVIVVANSFNAAAYSVFPPTGFSLQWYEKLAGVKKFLSGAKNSIVVALMAVGLGLLIGVPASYALARYRMRGRNAIQSLIMLPMTIPKIVFGLSMFICFMDFGLYNKLYGLGLAHSMLVLPYVVLMVTAAIKNISRQQEEAAMDLGARPVRVFFLILAPQITVPVVMSCALGFIVSFDQVEASIFLLRSTNYTLPIEMMIYMEKYQDPTIAALSTVVMAIVLTAFGLLMLSLRKKGDVISTLASSQKR